MTGGTFAMESELRRSWRGGPVQGLLSTCAYCVLFLSFGGCGMVVWVMPGVCSIDVGAGVVCLGWSGGVPAAGLLAGGVGEVVEIGVSDWLDGWALGAGFDRSLVWSLVWGSESCFLVVGVELVWVLSGVDEPVLLESLSGCLSAAWWGSSL